MQGSIFEILQEFFVQKMFCLISALLSPTCEICQIRMHRYGCIRGRLLQKRILTFLLMGLALLEVRFLKGTDALVHTQVPGVVVCCN